jgi:uncharacterized membrane protein
VTAIRVILIAVLGLTGLGTFALLADLAGRRIEAWEATILIAVLAIPATLIYLIIAEWRLDRRLSQLEARGLERAPPPPSREAVPKAVPRQADAPARDPEPAAAAPRPAPAMAVPPQVSAPITPRSDDRAAGEARPEPLAARLVAWVQANWVLAIAAVSLALAGVFLVQYGIEQGLLTPAMRVAGALTLGAALIAAGEWVRRRCGDTGSDTATIPSALAGAGLVSLTAGLLAGHLLYGLFGSGFTFAALVAVAGIAVALGWFYGPFLAAIGIAGALAVPFVVVPDPGAPILFAYLAPVVLAGLLIDTVRRWAWVSVLSLAAGFLAALAVHDAGGAGNGPGFTAFAIVVATAAASIPVRRWRPDHPGPALLAAWADRARASFPVLLAWGAFAAACAVALGVTEDAGNATGAWAGMVAMAALFLIAAIWFRPAPGLTDLALLPPLVFVAALGLQAIGNGPLLAPGAVAAIPGLPESAARPDHGPPARIAVLVAGAAIASAIAAWRGIAAGPFRLWWSAGAAVFAPAVLVILHLGWAPAAWFARHGDGVWALHVIAVAVAMVLFAERTARADAGTSRRVAGFALAAITLVAFALGLVLGPVPLTLAMGAMALAAALLDRRFDMDLLGLFIAGGTLLIYWRLGLPAGILTATRAPLGDVAIAYGGIVALLGATALTLRRRRRWRVRAGVEAAGWTLLAIFATLLLDRALTLHGLASPWGLGMAATLWLLSAGAVWLWRQAGQMPRRIALVLAGFHLAVALIALGLGVFPANPALPGAHPVGGPPLADTLLLAYALPGVTLAALAWRLPGLAGWARATGWSLGGALVALYFGLEIRRFWQGDNLANGGVTDGELYSYTIAMLIASAGLLYAAFAQRSVTLRRVAMAGIGLTVAKVFLIDMGGLTGLLRVAAFLGLGLALAALAWLDRRIAAQWQARPPG